MLECCTWREVSRGDKREAVGAEGVVGVAVGVLDHCAGLSAAKAGEEWSCVWVDDTVDVV